MNERIRLPWWAALAILSGAGAIIGVWDRAIALGVVAGGIWNLASLWCLARLLQAWLGPQPSRRRAIGWVLLKFPLLYIVLFGVLSRPVVSPVGFGAGFSLMLLMMLGWWLARRRTLFTHGR